MASTSELRIVNAGRKILERREDNGFALVLEQICIGGRTLEDRALRREIAEQCDQSSLRLQRFLALGDDGAVHPSVAFVRKPLAKRLSGHGLAVEVQKILQLAQQRAHAAGGEEILHVAVADRLEVHQDRRRVRQFIEPLQGNRNAGASGNRGQVNDGVGRAADRQQDAQRVLDGLLIDDLVGRQLRADQLHRGGAGCFGRAQTVGVHSRNCRRSRQDHAERFRNAGHGRSGAHDGARAGGRRETSLDFRNFTRRRSCRRGIGPRSDGNRCRRPAVRRDGGPSSSGRRPA